VWISKSKTERTKKGHQLNCEAAARAVVVELLEYLLAALFVYCSDVMNGSLTCFARRSHGIPATLSSCNFDLVT